jgi:streptogramin lyase
VATPGSAAGIEVLPLAPCDAGLCNAFPVLPPPTTLDPPSRAPAQMAVTLDPAGNTVLWFAEERANAIGVMQVSPTGQQLAMADIPCQCVFPTGIALDAGGRVWFAGGFSNQILRLTPNLANPTTSAVIDGFSIPSAVLVLDPVRPPTRTSSPHSVAVDHHGRVWFTEESTGKLAWLDPSSVKAGTTQGITELSVPNTDFNSQAAPADLVIDRADTVFFVDEYGDQVATATTAGVGRRWRPSTRISHTDHPIIDASGNLWFTESAAGLITRFSGVATPPIPTPTPTPTPTPIPNPTRAPVVTPILAPTPGPKPSPKHAPNSPTPPATQADRRVLSPMARDAALGFALESAGGIPLNPVTPSSSGNQVATGSTPQGAPGTLAQVSGSSAASGAATASGQGAVPGASERLAASRQGLGQSGDRGSLPERRAMLTLAALVSLVVAARLIFGNPKRCR